MGILRFSEGSFFPFRVDPVPFPDAFQNLLIRNGLSPFPNLLHTPLRPDFGRRNQKKLARGARKDDGSPVSSVRDNSRKDRLSSLQIEHFSAHGWKSGVARNDAVDFRRADEGCDIVSADTDALLPKRNGKRFESVRQRFSFNR